MIGLWGYSGLPGRDSDTKSPRVARETVLRDETRTLQHLYPVVYSVVLIFLLSKAIMVLSKKLVVFLVLQAIVVAVAVIWSKRHPDPEAFLQKKTLASNNPNLRFVASFLGQFMGFNPRASTSKSLEGQRILITGGTRGIGYEISKGLVE